MKYMRLNRTTRSQLQVLELHVVGTHVIPETIDSTCPCIYMYICAQLHDTM